jgi:hypothetical protein
LLPAKQIEKQISGHLSTPCRCCNVAQ